MIKKSLVKHLIIFVCIIFICVILGVATLGNQKGKNDIVVNDNSFEDNETVWWNNTELNTEPYTAPFFEVYKLQDLGQSAYGLDIADFNNDSWLDFVVSWSTAPWDHLSGISIFYRKSDNSFRIENIKFYDREIEDLDTVDFDDDGDIDIMCTRDNGNDEYSVNILWNENGNFEREEEVAHFNRSVGYWTNVHVATADFDMDGDVDFIAGANCGKVKLFKNDGFGNFSSFGVIFDYGDNSWGLDTGDFNDDGYPDFIVCARTDHDEYQFNDAGHIYLKLNDKTSSCFDNSTPGTLISSLPLEADDTLGKFVFGSVAVLDYNDDGLTDIIYGGDFKIFLFIQQINGSFSPSYVLALRDREYTWTDHLAEGGFTVGDFNYDGYDDVVVGGAQGTVRLLINNQTLVKIVKPMDRWRYVFGEPNYHLRYPGMKLVIGGIDVIAQGLEPLSRVDFYLDGSLVHSDDTVPFTWNWTKLGFRKYEVTAEAYDAEGQFAGKDVITVWKFL